MNDPFLGKRVEDGAFSTVPLWDEFLENARLFTFETYGSIHRRIYIGYGSIIKIYLTFDMKVLFISDLSKIIDLILISYSLLVSYSDIFHRRS